MPTIATFYGIRVYFNLKGKEHGPAHVHAEYGGQEASFTLSDGDLYQGQFPTRAKNLVKEFVLQNKEELQQMWNSGEYKQLKGLD